MEWLAHGGDILVSDIGKLAFIAVLILLFSFFEYYFAAEKGHSARGRGRNIGIILLFFFVGGVLLVSASLFTPINPIEFTYDSVFRSIIAVLIYMFIGDFVYYWYHRFEHTNSALWALHELHHSDQELNVTSSMRTYFLERPVQYLLVTVPGFIIITMTPLRDIAQLDTLGSTILPILFATWLFFTHTNVRLSLGPLTKVFTGPQLHRLHHSVEDKHRDKNFAQFFPIFDVLFGTYVAPQRNEFPKTGTPNLHSDVTVREILFSPFGVWKSLLTNSMQGRESSRK